MAISVDAVGTVESAASFSFTTSGADRVLVVFQTSGADGVIPTGITYAGVAMTKAGENVLDPLSRNTSIWYLLAPATGSNTVAVTTASTNFRTIAISYNGANDVTDYVTKVFNAVNNDTINAVSASGDWALEFVRQGGNSQITFASSQTVDFDGSLGNSMSIAHKTGTTNPALQITWIPNQTGTHSTVSLITGTQPTTTIKTFDGVAYANTKTVNGVAIANVKSWNGIE